MVQRASTISSSLPEKKLGINDEDREGMELRVGGNEDANNSVLLLSALFRGVANIDLSLVV
tara:strand:+ start:256 stop:438 length:183 start_codon:yes stop_codon:yes gene_type:complete